MKAKIFISLITVGLSIFMLPSCNNADTNKTSEKEIELQKKELDLKQKELELKEKQLAYDSTEKSNQKKTIQIEPTLNADNKEKNLTVIFKSYSCGDGCYFAFIDAITKKEVELNEWDNNKTNYQVAMEEIVSECQDKSCALQGQKYLATMKYKLIDELEYDGDGGFTKTGKKKWVWVVNSLKKVSNF